MVAAMLAGVGQRRGGVEHEVGRMDVERSLPRNFKLSLPALGASPAGLSDGESKSPPVSAAAEVQRTEEVPHGFVNIDPRHLIGTMAGGPVVGVDEATIAAHDAVHSVRVHIRTTVASGLRPWADWKSKCLRPSMNPVDPMLCLLVGTLPAGEEWIYEIK